MFLTALYLARSLSSASAWALQYTVYVFIYVYIYDGIRSAFQGRLLTTTEDREIELECVSKNGKPAAEVSFSMPISIFSNFDAEGMMLAL